MNVYIIRDAVEIGHFPREEIESLARRGELLPTDYYWHPGMNEWLPLTELIGQSAWAGPEQPDNTIAAAPPAPAPDAPVVEPSVAPLQPEPPTQSRERKAQDSPITPSRFAFSLQDLRDWLLANPRAGWGGGAVLLAILLLLFVSHHKKPVAVSATPPTSPAPIDLHTQALTDLKKALNKLPGIATPPLNTFYYGVDFNMTPSNSPYANYNAAIHGNENTIDPDTDQTVRRTEFLITADYTEGNWVFKTYDAVEVDLVTGNTVQKHDDAKSPLPPQLVGILGLKRF